MTCNDLERLYQQWTQGNEIADIKNYEFVQVIASHFQMKVSDVLQILNKCNWFNLIN